MTGFNSIEMAARMRDLLDSMIERRVNQIRPEERVGQVVSIDRDSSMAECKLAGDEGELSVHFTPSNEPRTEGVMVRIAGKPGDYYISEILGEPGVHATYEPIKELVESELGSDGLAPASSPEPVVIGGIRSLFIRWIPIVNNDPVTYLVHVSTTDAAFVPDASTLQGETTSSAFTIIDKLANNTDLVVDGTVFYYGKIVAKDVDGPAPASTAGIGVPRQVTGPDVSANYAYVGTIYVNQLLSGILSADVTVSGRFKTAETGQRAEMTTLGFFAYGPDNKEILSIPTSGEPMKLNAEVNAKSLTVEGDSEFFGNNTLGTSKTTTLAWKTSAPSSPPAATPGYDRYPGAFNNVLNVISGWHQGTFHDFYTGVFFGAGSITRRTKDDTSGPGTSVQIGAGGIHPSTGGKAGAKPIQPWGGVLEWIDAWSSASGALIPRLAVGGQLVEDANVFKVHLYYSPQRTVWTDMTDDDIFLDTDPDVDARGVWTFPQNHALHPPRLGQYCPNNDRICLAQVAFDSATSKWDRFQLSVVDPFTGTLETRYTSARIADLDVDENRSVTGCAVWEIFAATTRVFIANKNRVYAFTMSGSGTTGVLTRDTAYEWFLGHPTTGFSQERTGSTVTKILPGTFKSMQSVSENNTEIINYTDVAVNDSINGKTYYVANTWGKKATPTGYTYETTASNPKQFTWPKRGIVTFSVPSIPNPPGDANPPDAVAFYVGSAAPSTRLNRWLQAELPVGETQQILKVTPTLSGVQSPLANNFPNAVPHEFLSAATDSHLTKPSVVTAKGDGTWRTGPLESGTNLGEMLLFGSPVLAIATATLTVTASTTNPSVTVNYCKWCRIGRLVFLAWQVTFNTSGSGNYDFTVTGIPTADSGMTHMLPLQANTGMASVNLVWGYWNLNGAAGVGSNSQAGDLNTFGSPYIPSTARVEGFYIAST